MRRRVLLFAALATAAAGLLLLLVTRGGNWRSGVIAPSRSAPAPAPAPAPSPELARPQATSGPEPNDGRWQAHEPATDVALLALDGRTAAHLLGRGANRPLILILAAPGSPELEQCASRWRQLFEIYKDRVEFLTVFVGVAARGISDMGPEARVRQRIDSAKDFVQCNDWRIPVLVDGPGDESMAHYGSAPQCVVVLDEGRRILGAPLQPRAPSDLEPLSAWLAHRYRMGRPAVK